MSLSPKASGGCSASTSSGSTVFVREDAGSPVDGCVGLISSGSSSEESAFLDAAQKAKMCSSSQPQNSLPRMLTAQRARCV